jgi:hypothetical protein
MIYTFLFGIDAVFRISKFLLFHKFGYFLTYLLTILGWIFLRKNKSLLKTCLGFVFLPALPLFNTLYSFGSELRRFHIENFFKFGGIYFAVLLVSLTVILLMTKNKKLNKGGIQFVFIVLSGLMISIHSCIELITNFENYKNWEFFYLSILLIVFYYLTFIKTRIFYDEIKKSKVWNFIINFITSILFWVYIILYDFICFAFAAGSV